MKLPSVILGVLLCAGILFPATCPTAMAGSGRAPEAVSAPAETAAPAAPLPGTGAEAAAYERREERSPEVQEFTGGHAVVVGAGFVLLVLLVVLLVVLLGD